MGMSSDSRNTKEEYGRGQVFFFHQFDAQNCLMHQCIFIPVYGMYCGRYSVVLLLLHNWIEVDFIQWMQKHKHCKHWLGYVRGPDDLKNFEKLKIINWSDNSYKKYEQVSE